MNFNMIFDEEAVNASNAAAKAARIGDRRICICGHNARSHASQAGEDSPLHDLFAARGTETCTPGRQQCPCKEFRAVAETSNVRLFIFKSSGSYANHALTKGIAQAKTKGASVGPIGDWSCDSCKRLDVPVGPVGLNTVKRETNNPAEYNLLLCGDCVTSLRLGTLFA